MPTRKRVTVFLHLTLLVAVVLFSLTSVKAQTEDEVKAALVNALTLIDQQRYAEAIPHLELLIKVVPDNPKLRFYYGFALVAKSKQADNNEEAKKLSVQALEQLKKAKELGFTDPANDQLISLLSDGGGNFESSSGYSKNAEAQKFMNQAENKFAQSNYDEALAFYQKAFALDPNIYEAALYSGDAYTMKQDWNNAEIWYQKAIKINPLRETAYRYSATPLMKQNKYDQARDRYIEAFITEPYSRTAPGGIAQWAEKTGAKLGHPKVDFPELKFDANGKAVSGKTDNAGLDWAAYTAVRESWRKEKFAKTFPAEKSYRHSLQEEAEAVRSVLKSAATQKSGDSQVEILRKLDSEGLLEAYILMAQPDDGIAEDHEAYLKNNRDKLRQYVLNYVIHK